MSDRIDLDAIRHGHAPLTPATVAALVEAVEALRVIEFTWSGDGDICPSCGMSETRGHDASCPTAAALARFRWEDTP